MISSLLGQQRRHTGIISVRDQSNTPWELCAELGDGHDRVPREVFLLVMLGTIARGPIREKSLTSLRKSPYRPEDGLD